MGYGDNNAFWGTSGAMIRAGISDPPGGSATYGPWVSLPGINSLTATANMITDDAKGNDQIVATASRLMAWDLKFGVGLESIAALQTFLGGTVTTTGTSPNQVESHTYPQGSVPGWFEILVQSTEEDGAVAGGVTRDFYKCTITKFDIGNQTEKFSQPAFEARAIRRKSDGQLHKFTVEETQSALPASGASSSTPPTVSSTVPLNAASGVLTSATISITFSEALAPSSAADLGSYYLAAAVAGTAVPFTVSYNASTFVVTLTPVSALTSATEYVCGVTPAIRDLYDNRLASQYSFKFNT